MFYSGTLLRRNLYVTISHDSILTRFGKVIYKKDYLMLQKMSTLENFQKKLLENFQEKLRGTITLKQK